MKIKTLAKFLFILVLFTLSVAYAASDTQSLNSRDSIFISKVTPRTGSYLIPPATFPYFLEVEYHLTTQRKGIIEISVYRYPYTRKSGQTSLIKPVVQPITKGTGSLLFTSTNLTIHGTDQNKTISLVVSLKDTKGNELAYSTSNNIVAGSRKVISGAGTPPSDYVQILETVPKAKGIVEAGKRNKFKFKFAYGIKTTEYAFLNFEFSDINELSTGLCWEAICVPLTKGTGLMQVELPLYFSIGYRGKTMGIGVPLRIDPLGGTVSYDIIKPFTFK
jgi:hypothetical protein